MNLNTRVEQSQRKPDDPVRAQMERIPEKGPEPWSTSGLPEPTCSIQRLQIHELIRSLFFKLV